MNQNSKIVISRISYLIVLLNSEKLNLKIDKEYNNYRSGTNLNFILPIVGNY